MLQFVCLGGKPSRMKDFAEIMYEALGGPKNTEFQEGKEKSGEMKSKAE